MGERRQRTERGTRRNDGRARRRTKFREAPEAWVDVGYHSNWREGLERKFRFDPAAFADPLEVHRVDREIAVQRIGLMRELRIRIVGLENQARRIRDDRATLWKRLEAAFNARMLAQQADLAADNN